MAALRGDGNDVETVYHLAGEAISRARSGEGPTIIELATYRWMEHCGPNGDIELNYRTATELAAWKERDPVAAYRETLIAAGQMTPAEDLALRRQIEDEVDQAFSFARGSAFPPASDLLSHVYPKQPSLP
jgi:pyruvate dehydrogenase E1 component alpha subunit